MGENPLFCRIGRKDRHTLSLWTMVLGLIPSISLWIQAKTSRLLFRKRASSLRTEGLACVSIRVVRPGVSSSKETSSRSSVGSTMTFLSSLVKAYKWLSISSMAMLHSRAAIWSLHAFPIPYFVGNFTNRWHVDVAARHVLSMRRPMMALSAEEQSTTRKLTSLVSYRRYVLMVTGKIMVPMGKTLVPPNPTNGMSKGWRRSRSILIC